jgi:muramidase (phage lysozyme)
VPELSRFYGIIIRMFAEVGTQHHVPHFHAYYQEDVAIFSIEPVEIIAGSLPKRQQRLVEAWAELHGKELAADWESLQKGSTPQPIEPLK